MTRPHQEPPAVARRGAPSALLLRPWSEGDAVGLRAAIDEDLGHLKPWLSWTLEEPATLERTRARLRAWAEQLRRGEGFRWAVTPADRPDEILGGANLGCRLGPGAHDVGYWVRASAARRGVASSAVARLVVHAFEVRGVERLEARCDRGNAPSEALARALHFEPRGESVVEYPDGAPRPVRILELRREDYRTRHGDALRRLAERARLVT